MIWHDRTVLYLQIFHYIKTNLNTSHSRPPVRIDKLSCVPAIGGASTAANISAVDSVPADIAGIHAIAGVPTGVYILIGCPVVTWVTYFLGFDSPAVLASPQVPVVSCDAVDRPVTDVLLLLRSLESCCVYSLCCCCCPYCCWRSLLLLLLPTFLASLVLLTLILFWLTCRCWVPAIANVTAVAIVLHYWRVTILLLLSSVLLLLYWKSTILD